MPWRHRHERSNISMLHLRSPLCLRLSALIFFLLALLLNVVSFIITTLPRTPIDTLVHDHRQLPTVLERESLAAAATVKRQESFSDDVDALFLCDRCTARTSNDPRVIALVELRNVAPFVHDFLSALSPIVDGVVALDDHSDDATRAVLLERCASLGRSTCKLDALLNKTGLWSRQELRDRELLLRAGRRVGGTHFVLLDYDERFASACTHADSLRAAIRALPSGNSLFIPWVELWKSPSLHRVLPTDRAMNFLVRRQTVVFADDGRISYASNSSGARTLGASASIHALRCPRTVCPRPPRYVGPHTPLSADARVNIAPSSCHVVEARFLHVPNALLKAAWYEGLGRVSHAPPGTTRGKMLDVLFPRARIRPAPVALQRVDSAWLSERDVRAALRAQRVERWRATHLVRWLDDIGDRSFDDLAAVRAIDTSALRDAETRASVLSGAAWLHVPMRKRGTLVIAAASPSASCFTSLFAHVGAEVELNGSALAKRAHAFMSQTVSMRPGPGVVDFEDWVRSVVSAVRKAVSKSRRNVATLSVVGVPTDQFSSLVKFASLELAQFDVVFAFALMAGDNGDSDKLTRVTAAATRPGSHVRALAVHASALGSFSALLWMRHRICGRDAISEDEQRSLLSIAEDGHELCKTENMQPVARVMFSLNVGRSGSKYLADVFATLGRAVRALHEPRCSDGTCSGGGAMSMQNVSLKRSYDERLGVKVPMVKESIAHIAVDGVRGTVATNSGGFETCAELLSSAELYTGRLMAEMDSTGGCSGSALKDAVYVETNPNFKSWFYDVTLDTLPKRGYAVTVLVLRKYMAAALMSLYETGYFTSRNGYNWMETSNSVNAVVRSIGRDDELDAFDKIISYLINAEEVTRQIVQKYSARNVTFLEVRSEDVYSSDGALRLLRNLALRPRPQTIAVVGRKADKYRSGKKQMSTTLDTCERRVQRYLAKCTELGIAIPSEMAQLKRFPNFKYRTA